MKLPPAGTQISESCQPLYHHLIDCLFLRSSDANAVELPPAATQISERQTVPDIRLSIASARMGSLVHSNMAMGTDNCSFAENGHQSDTLCAATIKWDTRYRCN